MSDLVLGSTTVLSDSSGTPTIQSGVLLPAGSIVNAEVVENGTRYAVSGSSSSDVELISFGNYNKLNASTDLIITICLFTFASDDQWTGNVGLRYGSSSTYWAQTYTYNDVEKGQQLNIWAKFSGYTTTGSQAISIRNGQSGTGTSRPAQIINPSSSDDNRINNSGKSVAIIYEVNT